MSVKVKDVITSDLSSIKPGNSGTVTHLYGDGALKRRLMDMGITPGAEVFVRKSAPLGDPIQINVRGYQLSIRKADAKNIKIELIKGDSDNAGITDANEKQKSED